MSDSVDVKKDSARRTRRSFLVGGAAAIGTYGLYHELYKAHWIESIHWPLRKSFNFNAAVRRGLCREAALAPTYPVAQSVNLRINGDYGLKDDLLLDSYRLQVVGVDGAEHMPQYVQDVTAWTYKYDTNDDDKEVIPVSTKEAPPAYGGAKPGPRNAGTAKDMSAASAGAAPAAKDNGPMPGFDKAFEAAQNANDDGRAPRGREEAGLSDSTLDPGTPGLLLTLDDLKQFQREELVTQFKCIEGWSEIVHWGGFKLADFIKKYPPKRNNKGEFPRYVYMETPNGDYYTGYNLQICMHPQSLLCTEMAGKPLTQAHGSPLRLHMPTKYGYKQIKRIGLIAYTDDKPDDYWTKLGYDWYAGL